MYCFDFKIVSTDFATNIFVSHFLGKIPRIHFRKAETHESEVFRTKVGVYRGTGAPVLVSSVSSFVRHDIVTLFGFRLGGGVPHGQKFRVVGLRFVRFKTRPAISKIILGLHNSKRSKNTFT